MEIIFDDGRMTVNQRKKGKLLVFETETPDGICNVALNLEDAKKLRAALNAFILDQDRTPFITSSKTIRA